MATDTNTNNSVSAQANGPIAQILQRTPLDPVIPAPIKPILGYSSNPNPPADVIVYTPSNPSWPKKVKLIKTNSYYCPPCQVGDIFVYQWNQTTDVEKYYCSRAEYGITTDAAQDREYFEPVDDSQSRTISASI